MTRYILIDCSGNTYTRESRDAVMKIINDNPDAFLMLHKQEYDGTDWQTVEESVHNKITMRGPSTTVSTDYIARTY